MIDNILPPSEFLISTLNDKKNLDVTGDEDALNFLQTCGFLFSVCCAPDPVPPSEWLPVIFGGDLEFSTDDGVQQFFAEIMGLFNQINDAVLAGESVFPPELEIKPNLRDNFGEDAPLGQWSIGFMTGYGWLSEMWERYSEDEVFEELSAQVFVLCLFSDYDEMKEIHETEDGSVDDLPPFDEFAQSILDDGILSEAIIGFGYMGRELGEQTRHTPHVAEPKVGRNEPCPCGSGKKYKKCCQP